MLDKFPVEVLALVVDNLNGRHLGLLWRTGNGKLNYKLGIGGAVKHFSLKLDSLYPSLWPSLVICFPHLTSFSILAEPTSEVLYDWHPTRLDLPRNLRSLTLCGSDEFTLLIEAVRSDASAFSLLETLIAPSTTKQASEDLFKLCQEGRFPRLESLTLKDSHLDTVPIVPSQVKHLSIEVNGADVPSGVRVFPEGLETLNLELFIFDIEGSDCFDLLDAMPSSLRSLTFNHLMMGHEIDTDFLSRLPRGLTRLNCALRYKEISEQDFRALPPALTDLDLGLSARILEPEECIAMSKFLPAGLTRFSGAPRATQDSIKFFPPRLTQIGEVVYDPLVYEHLPPGLTYLSHSPINPEGEPKDDVVWPLLPRTITSIFGIGTGYVAQHALPEKLTEVTINRGFLTTTQLRNHLPQGLLSLQLNLASTNPEMPICDAMPRHLTSLTIQAEGLVMSAQECESLPKTLRILSIVRALFECPQPFENFPNQLEYLNLGASGLGIDCLRGLRSSKMRSLNLTLPDFPPGLAHNLCMTLPKRLKRFGLQASNPSHRSTDLTDDSLAKLPVGLQILNLANSPLITKCLLANLPRHMQIYFEGVRPSWAPKGVK